MFVPIYVMDFLGTNRQKHTLNYPMQTNGGRTCRPCFSIHLERLGYRQANDSWQ
jgi:hypothetical protein